jgi:hypothetical protein
MGTSTSKSGKSLADQAVEIIPAEMGERLSEAREGLDELDQRIRHTVSEHPLMCVAGAILTGYLVGRVIARRS